MDKDFGLISSIQRLSTEDGPGIRTTVFFKGCNMHCSWCHNPEAISDSYSLGIETSKCNACGKCISVCPTQALKLNKNELIFDREKCNNCLKCENECFFDVFTVSGKKYSVDSLVKEIMKDQAYYKQSNGGVTFSGGEPLCQKDFLLATMIELDKKGISTCIQSNFSIPFDDTIKEIAKLCSIFYIDLKFSTEELHKEWTGIGIEGIHKNLKELDKLDTRIVIRTPVVEMANDNIDELCRIAEFAKSLKHLEGYYLVPYHPLGLSKYKQFGIKIVYNNRNFFDKKKLEEYQQQVDKVIEG